MNITEIMEAKGTPTLKAIAAVFGIPTQRIYSVAKQPKEGEVYDAKVYNWDAITRFIERRLDADKGLATLEDVIDAALAKDAEFKESDGRRTANRGQGINQKIEVDGKMVAVRKYKNFEMSEGKPICLRKDANVYGIVMQTLTHTVLRPINEDGSFASETVKVISNSMLNMKGAGPASIDEAIQKRFSGEYVVPADPDATKASDAE
jgi:hypothetical protein